MCFVNISRLRKLSPQLIHLRMSLVCWSARPIQTSWPLTSFLGMGSCSFRMSRAGAGEGLGEVDIDDTGDDIDMEVLSGEEAGGCPAREYGRE